MEQKKQTTITNIAMEEQVLGGEEFQPTLINFFFGKNGTGKSTIARQIKAKKGCTWLPGEDSESYELKIYNEDYIKDEVQGVGNLPGVFTLTKENAQAKARIDKANARKTELKKEQSQNVAAKQKISDDEAAIYRKMLDDMWEKVKPYQQMYPEALRGFVRDKKKFEGELRKYQAVAHDESEITTLYATAFGKGAQEYASYRVLQSAELPESPLMDKQIVSSGSTPFASFVKALNNLAWVQQGHEMYHAQADGKCPYCQQAIPVTFESDLASCFDRQYQEDMNGLTVFYNSYREALTNIYRIFEANIQIGFDSQYAQEYEDKLALFKEKGQQNLDRIKQKQQNPSVPASLDKAVDDLMVEINRLSYKINDLIKENNAILKDLKRQKENCKRMVWERLVFVCQGDIATYKTKNDAVQQSKDKNSQEAIRLKNEMAAVEKEIEDQSSNTKNTTTAMNNINDLIDANGFQGFHLREKPNTQYIYEVVRDNGEIAHGLSEGEKHIIAFLYFYQTIIGTQADDGKRHDKIVVIDDPVSSMDSNSMALVAQLIRNLTKICYNNYKMTNEEDRDDYIKQFFCLTHNPYFFREITYNRIADYKCVNLYELKKGEGNHSTITCCVAVNKNVVGGKEENYSPVKNHYDALWYEYRNTDDPIALMNVIRQILEYFFLQICGYDGGNLRIALLDKRNDLFESQADYDLAYSLLELVDSAGAGINDGIFFDRSAVDKKQCRDVFERLFTVMGQDQHYKLMMGEK